MDTLSYMTNAIDYIENHLDRDIDYKKIEKIALCSIYHFQRMFTFLIGITLSQYIRQRRLTLAAYDLQNTNDRVIDIAMKYGYTSADAFSRAFQSIHHITPSKARSSGVSLKAYPRVSFSLSLKGIGEMKYRIETKEAFNIVGIKERLSYSDNLGASVGQMWANMTPDTMMKIQSLNNTQPFGLIGAYSEMYEDDTTDYYIGTVTTQPVPKEFESLEIPQQTWVVFEITGPLPKAMSDVWGRIFSEWFLSMAYEHTPAPEIEWYSNGDMSQDDYQSEIWIPIHKK